MSQMDIFIEQALNISLSISTPDSKGGSQIVKNGAGGGWNFYVLNLFGDS